MEPDFGAVCLSHLAFTKWADETLLSALQQVPADKLTLDTGTSFQSMLGTLTHVYLAEWVWLKRVQGEHGAQMANAQSPPDINALAQVWGGVHHSWLDWAGSLNVGDWPKPCVYKNSRGDEFSTPNYQIVLHVVNHGSYHRGQLATLLRQAGLQPPGTDLIMFYRTL